MPEETEVAKVSLIMDATQFDAKVQESEKKLKDFKNLTVEQARIKFSATIVDLQQKMDEARARLRQFKKDGDQAGQIKARFDILELQKGVTQAKSGLREVEKSAADTGKSFFSLGSIVKDAVKAFIAFAGIQSVIGFFRGSEAAAASASEAFTGVRQKVQGTKEELDKLIGGLRQLATEKGVFSTVEGLAKIAETAGQLGLKANDVLAFTKTVDQLSAVSGIAGADVASTFSKIINIFQLTQGEFGSFASTVVDLGNKFAVSESDVLAFAQVLSASGRQAGLTVQQVLGLAAAFTSVGIDSGQGANSVQKALNAISVAVATGNKDLAHFAATAGLSIADFKKLFEEDAASAFEKFIKGLGSGGAEAILTLQELGLGSNKMIKSFQAIAGNSDLLTRALGTANDAFRENSALAAEVAIKNEDAKVKIEHFAKIWNDLKITVGNFILLALLPFLEGLGELVKSFGKGESALGNFNTAAGTAKTVIYTVAAAITVALVPALSTLLIEIIPITAALIAVTSALKDYGEEAARAAAATKILDTAASSTDTLSAALTQFKAAADGIKENPLNIGVNDSMEKASEAAAKLRKEIELLGNRSGVSKDLILKFQKEIGNTRDTERAAFTTEKFRLIATESFQKIASEAQENFDRVTKTQKNINFEDALNSVRGFRKVSDEAWIEVVKSIAVAAAKGGDVAKSFAIFAAAGIKDPVAVGTLAKAGITAVEIMASEIGKKEIGNFKNLGISFASALREGFFGLISKFIPDFTGVVNRLAAPLQALGINTSKVSGALGGLFSGLTGGFGNTIGAITTAYQAIKNGALNAAGANKDLSVAAAQSVTTISSLTNEASVLEDTLKDLPVGSKAFIDTASKLKDVRTQLSALNKESSASGGKGKTFVDPTINSIEGLTEKLRLLKIEFDKAIVGTENYRQLGEQVKTLTAQLKEATDLETQSGNSLDGLKAKLKDLQDQLGKTEVGTAEFGKLKTEADALDKKIKELSLTQEDFENNIEKAGKTYQDITNDIRKDTEKLADDMDKFYSDIAASIAKATDEQNKLRTGLTDFKTEETGKLVADLAKRDADLQKQQDELNKKGFSAEGASEEDFAKLREIEAERKKIQEFIASSGNQTAFKDARSTAGKSEAEQRIAEFQQSIKDKEEETKKEIEKQQRIIDINTQFQNLSKENLASFLDDQGKVQKEKVVDFLEKQTGLKLTEEEKSDALLQAKKLEDFAIEQQNLDNQEAALFDIKKKWLDQFGQVFNDSVDAQKTKFQELIDMISEAAAQQVILNNLQGRAATGSTTNSVTQNNNGPVTINTPADLDAFRKKIVEDLTRGLQLSRKSSS